MLTVFDEISNAFVPEINCKRVIVEATPDLIRYGYVPLIRQLVTIKYFDIHGTEKAECDYELLKDNLIFSQVFGTYLFKCDLEEGDILYQTSFIGHNMFPYSFDRTYEAINVMSYFSNKQFLEKEYTFEKLSPYFKYTFGLEFETCGGIIPQNICLRDGLIPLRDGSISGLEYTTVVLNGNFGLNLLRQQLGTLKKYCHYNKECSLHVHLGGCPLNAEYIFNVYKICRALETDLQRYVPRLTFKTSSYKRNGKDYCKFLPSKSSFPDLYSYLVGRPYFGNLEQPHPNDLRRQSKWNQSGRYYWCNFMNILCFTVNKTIEFRFLRPTYNYKKILFWLYIFNAILLLAEKKITKFPTTLDKLLAKVYHEELCNTLINGLTRSAALVKCQTDCDDECGSMIEFDDVFFTDDLDW